MRAALEHLAARAGERPRRAILGEMAELGAASLAYHLEIGELAKALGIEIIGVGEPARAYSPVALAASADEALALAKERIRPGDAVLVKASRSAELEGIADEITNFARAWSLS
jgi:UDP-N-acetylmuramoyl-tripeptide--D-alanyl-D-alanine ligase